MKEIKFRAWNKERREMNQVKGLSFVAHQDGRLDFIDAGWKWMPEVFELMQFTGIHDKNQREIYEGDLLKHETGFISEIGKNKLSEVVWHELGWYYKWIELEHLDEESGLMNKSQITYTKIYDSDKNVEIVGNIYENPDLYNNLLNGDE